METEKENECTEHDSDILPEETEEQQNSWYICRVHGKDFMPLLCKDCESTVCFDCIVTTHVGHNMCKISDGIEEKIVKLNDAIQKKESACFDLNEIKENLQKRRQFVKNQKELMVQQVTDREEEIVREVKKVCQQTIEQISNLATKIESPLIRDEVLLNSLMECDLFEKDNDKDCIKSLYFYKKLKLLDGKSTSENREELPFKFVTRDLPLEKIHELVGSVMAEELLSSEDDVLKSETRADNSGTNSTNKEVVQPSMHQKKVLDGDIDINAIILISPEKSLLCSKRTLYLQTEENVDKILEEIDCFTYVPKLEEVIFTLRGSGSEKCFWRQPITNKEQRTSFMTIPCVEVAAMSHDDTHYLTVLFVTSHTKQDFIKYKKFSVGLIDDTGCLYKPILTLAEKPACRTMNFKIMKSLIVVFEIHSVTMYKGSKIFSYSGSVGIDPSKKFRPIDLCSDPDGNFLVIDSHDSTVHLLGPTGKFLRIIMSAEDGICDVCCVSMDVSGWLRFGSKNGFLRSAYYKHFKDTTREERRLEKMKLK